MNSVANVNTQDTGIGFDIAAVMATTFSYCITGQIEFVLLSILLKSESGCANSTQLLQKL